MEKIYLQEVEEYTLEDALANLKSRLKIGSYFMSVDRKEKIETFSYTISRDGVIILMINNKRVYGNYFVLLSEEESLLASNTFKSYKKLKELKGQYITVSGTNFNIVRIDIYEYDFMDVCLNCIELNEVFNERIYFKIGKDPIDVLMNSIKKLVNTLNKSVKVFVLKQKVFNNYFIMEILSTNREESYNKVKSKINTNDNLYFDYIYLPRDKYYASF